MMHPPHDRLSRPGPDRAPDAPTQGLARCRRLPRSGRTQEAFPARGVAALALALALGLGGCSTVTYYLQAIHGQVELLRKARPMEALVADPAQPTVLRERLRRALALREFASASLGLPQNGSYRRYSDLGRRYVVWNVIAAPEFATAPRQWCFPVAGCVGYRGYFNEAGAEAMAAGLRQEGLDVYVGGVAAYSTLGWFADPLPNTVIHYPEAELARLIFHELAHQVVYLPGDTAFNESFATAVELEGVRRWIKQRGIAQQQQAFDEAQQRRREFITLVLGTREELDAVYARGLAPQAIRGAKSAAIIALRERYARLKASWGDYAGYDAWFAGEINNARIASVALYTQWVPGFTRLLAERAGDLPAFYREAAQLAKATPSERARRLGLDGG